MIKKQKIWVRIAGNAKEVRAGKPHGWRCFLGDASGTHFGEEIPLIHWLFVGTATVHNAVPGIKPNASKEDSVLAWIDLFGNVEIENDILHVTLQNPKTK